MITANGVFRHDRDGFVDDVSSTTRQTPFARCNRRDNVGIDSAGGFAAMRTRANRGGDVLDPFGDQLAFVDFNILRQLFQQFVSIPTWLAAVSD